MQVTINDVIYAVNAALDTAFPDIPIANEEIKQNLDPPRFFVRLLEPAHTQELGRRYRRDMPFVVRYFSPERANEDMYDKAERLTSALEWITIGGRPWPARGMHFEIVDEVLHFFFSLSFIVWIREPEAPKMQELIQEVYVFELEED
ncbi:phage tail terminator family protein [Cohnella algarum]|uniref:phage tail terminator family protein n=1 Tax=Cohnella algarum TaxID=2044859 RepID=UPI001967A632|nr:hypothetical protein [Cohnella algarum]MBN2980117.1 hypothetical protein [Cohnella algarum]